MMMTMMVTMNGVMMVMMMLMMIMMIMTTMKMTCTHNWATCTQGQKRTIKDKKDI